MQRAQERQALNANPTIVIALAAVLTGCQFAICWLAYRVVRDDSVRREQEHQFMLSVMERQQATSLAEVAEAEVVREAARSENEMRVATEVGRSAEVVKQHDSGWFGDLAEGRAAMAMAGFDPDDEDAVAAWNARFGEVVS